MEPKRGLKQMAAVARGLARALTASAGWLGDRIEDLAVWLANLVRYLPVRLGRLVLTLVLGLIGLIILVPIGLRVWRRGGRGHFAAWGRARLRRGVVRVVQLVLQVSDLIGLPELFALAWRAATRATPLTGDEIAAAEMVLGRAALRFQDIRVAEGGILRLVFAANGSRAFATFHTVNLPKHGSHRRSSTDILLHELVHVFQYERAGSPYFAEALLAQRREGYGYGGPDGLRAAWSQGRRLRDYNREQQAQIAQDYYMHVSHDGDVSAYEPFIAELRAGRI